ncbi:hypothetical protein KKI23_02340, partial [Patescibacteria group bacterium]|nr:hypothetical protein [Patescibacteria group bacterium]
MGDENKEQYLSLLTEIVGKQAIILGPDIAVLKARNVGGLKVADDGKVTDYQGNPQELIKELVDKYVELSGQIVKSALTSVFAKYPTIKNEDCN